jgi:telomere length regulation protein
MEVHGGASFLTDTFTNTTELYLLSQVHGHKDAYVRRASLLAAGQVLASLPVDRVAAALTSLMPPHPTAMLWPSENVLKSSNIIAGSTHPTWLLLDSSMGGVDVLDNGAGSRGGRKSRGTAVADELLLERLEWIQGWLREAASGDMDETCRMMAEACVNIQAGLARQALQDLHEQDERGQLMMGVATMQDRLLAERRAQVE